MDDTICNTPITGVYIAKHMKEALGPSAVLKSFEAEKIAVGQGFVASILRLRLSWEQNVENRFPATVIVKAPKVESLHKLFETLPRGDVEESEKMKAAMAQMVIVIHKTECDFYNTFGTSAPVALAKCFVALPVSEDAPGMIILEDLSDKASIIPSLLDGLTYPQLISTVKELARLHAFSLTTQTDWRSNFPCMEDREQMMKSVLEPALGGFKIAKENYPDHFGHIDLDKLTSLYKYDREKFLALMNEHRQFMDDVLIHGDCHANNIMFEKENDAVGNRVTAMIDFQGALGGSPALDLGRLLVFSVSPKLRRDNYYAIIRAYFDEVKTLAGDKFTATLEQVKRMTDNQFAWGALFFTALIPMMQMVMIKSEGEQKENDEKKLLDIVRANYDDAAAILGI